MRLRIESVSWPYVDGSLRMMNRIRHLARARQDCEADLLVALLHEAAQDDVAVGLRPRDNVRLVVLAVAHHIRAHRGGSCENDLAAGREALGVLYAGQRPGRVAGAVEDDLGPGAGVGRLDAGQLLAEEADAVVVFEQVVEVCEVFGRVDGDACAGHAVFDTGG